MEKLQQEINSLLDKLPNREEFQDRLDALVSVYPFNKYEYAISTLLAMGILSLDEYYKLRDDYISRNPNRHVFEITAPRTFGESWVQGHLKEMVPSLQTPSKRIDKNYSGQYDLYLDDIRIEVKASRAVDADSKEPLYDKALSSSSAKRFCMNFQQVKPKYCDVFVFVAVWLDIIKYWVLSSYEVETNYYYCPTQHKDNIGEGQIHIKQNNIQEFIEYEIKPDKLEEAIRRSYNRQLQTTTNNGED